MSAERRVAFHEAAHCLAGLHAGFPVADVTIGSDGTGETIFGPEGSASRPPVTSECVPNLLPGMLEGVAVRTIAGAVADALFGLPLGDPMHGDDLLAVHRIADRLGRDRDAFTREVFATADRYLWREVPAEWLTLATALMRRRKLTGADVRALLRAA